MRIAVVGAGLAGLAAACALKKRGHSLALYDRKGVGKGASGIASGLCHPYPGRGPKRSKYADAAMEAAYELVDLSEKVLGEKVALRNGILKRGWTPYEWYNDLKQTDEGILVTSGMTIFMPKYLEGLFRFLDEPLHVGEVDLERLQEEYDRVVLAIGAGIFAFPFSLPIAKNKGQILTFLTKKAPERSISGDGHISPLGNGRVQIGSTYEHDFTGEEVEEGKAQTLLLPKVEKFINIEDLTYESTSAGMRVAVKGSYLPLLRQVGDKMIVVTGFGSRGLLYHALYGKLVAELL